MALVQKHLDAKKDTVSVIDLCVPKGEVTYTMSVTCWAMSLENSSSGPSWYLTLKRRVTLLNREFRKLMQL